MSSSANHELSRAQTVRARRIFHVNLPFQILILPISLFLAFLPMTMHDNCCLKSSMDDGWCAVQVQKYPLAVFLVMAFSNVSANCILLKAPMDLCDLDTMHLMYSIPTHWQCDQPASCLFFPKNSNWERSKASQFQTKLLLFHLIWGYLQGSKSIYLFTKKASYCQKKAS